MKQTNKKKERQKKKDGNRSEKEKQRWEIAPSSIKPCQSTGPSRKGCFVLQVGSTKVSLQEPQKTSGKNSFGAQGWW